MKQSHKIPVQMPSGEYSGKLSQAQAYNIERKLMRYIKGHEREVYFTTKILKMETSEQQQLLEEDDPLLAIEEKLIKKNKTYQSEVTHRKCRHCKQVKELKLFIRQGVVKKICQQCENSEEYRCNKCGKIKAKEYFYLQYNKQGVLHRKRSCKECTTKYLRGWRKKKK